MDESRTLLDELASLKGENVYIGARSSFFFIGPAEEAIANLALISAMLRHATIFPPHRKTRFKLDEAEGQKLGQRKVIKSYDHDIYGGGRVILVEGKEFGLYWTREEYLWKRSKAMQLVGLSGTTSRNPAFE